MGEDRVLLKALKNKNKKSGLVGVHLSSAGVAIAHRINAGEQSRLQGCDFIPATGAGAQQKALKEAVRELGVRDFGTNFVLAPNQYSLVLVEAPQVPEEEMKQAVRWRIKDMVSFDVTEAAIDIIPLPEDGNRARPRMIYVVAAQRSVVDQVEQLCAEAELKLDYVDIPELALCNLIRGFDQEDIGTAVVFLGEGEGLINLIKNRDLYLTRKLKANIVQLTASDSASSNAFNHLLLEIQRSLDYYLSQLGQTAATQLWLAPLATSRAHLQQDFAANLGLQTQVMDLGELMPGAEGMAHELQESCALAIGGAFRRE